jgi:glyoxylase I family protein
MPLQVEGLAPLFQVFDMPASIHFYRDLLGFEVINTSKPLSERADDVNWAMLQLSGTTLMLNTAYEPSTAQPRPTPRELPRIRILRCTSHAGT